MRRELITAIEQDGLNNRIVNMLFIVHNENIDLQEAIKKSAAEYLNTDEDCWLILEMATVLNGKIFGNPYQMKSAANMVLKKILYLFQGKQR